MKGEHYFKNNKINIRVRVHVLLMVRLVFRAM